MPAAEVAAEKVNVLDVMQSVGAHYIYSRDLEPELA